MFQQSPKESAFPSYGIYVLGAGFSRPAGLPLASELWGMIKDEAQSISGLGDIFKQDLDEYLRYYRECNGISLTEDQVQFEEFMAFLDIEHYLGLKGSDTWSQDGNKTQVLIKNLIGQILTTHTPPKNRVPELYLEFAKLLQPQDYVLTFNYDVLLERALDAVGKPYRLFPQRYQEVYEYQSITADSRDEIVIFKMHGSVDWFDRSGYAEIESYREKQHLQSSLSHPVFGRISELGITPLTDGPRPADDSLSNVYRMSEIDRFYSAQPTLLAAPLLLNPSPAKLVYSNSFRRLWSGIGQIGALNFTMAIIGFSMPTQDEYLRQVIYRIVRNYQRCNWSEEVLGHRKMPLIMIDFRESDEARNQLTSRYSFVDWNKASTYFAGFDQSALQLLRTSTPHN